MPDIEIPPPNVAATEQAPVPPPAGPAPVPERETNADARIWAAFCHIAGLAFLLPAVPGIGGIVGALIVWAIRKDRFPFVNEQGKEAINFQMTMFIYGLICFVIMFVFRPVAILLAAIVLIDILLTIIAAVRANEGYHHRYPQPFIIRFIK